jgi:hypothetical protein
MFRPDNRINKILYKSCVSFFLSMLCLPYNLLQVVVDIFDKLNVYPVYPVILSNIFFSVELVLCRVNPVHTLSASHYLCPTVSVLSSRARSYP